MPKIPLKLLLFASIALNIIAGYLALSSYWSKTKKNELLRTEVPERTLNKSLIHNSLPIDTNSIVFVGNSITERMNWAEYYQNLNVKDRGIGGDNSLGLKFRIGDIARQHPKKIFVMMGINDLLIKRPFDRFVSDYKAAVDSIQLISPNTIIYLQSTLPNSKVNPNYIQQKDIKKLNKEVELLAERENVYYINLFDHFLNDEGELSAEYGFDGLHLTLEGYNLWQTIIRPYLPELHIPSI